MIEVEEKPECDHVHGVQIYDGVDGYRDIRNIYSDERLQLKKCDRYEFCPWCGTKLGVDGE